MQLSAKEAQAKLGSVLWPRYEQYKTDRKQLEDQWVKNLRQYRGVYDPEVADSIPPDKSHVYPKETHTKVVGFVAKMMEMLFPAADKNWSISPTPIPSLPEQVTNELIAKLQRSKVEAAAQTQSTPEPINTKEIEAVIKEEAAIRAKRMETLVHDILLDLGGDTIDFSQLSKRVLRSGGIYGYGILKGPTVRHKEERTFELDAATGGYKASTKKVPRPFFEWCKVWDFYPDLSAKSWRGQDGVFERMVMTKHAVILLKNRVDFDADAVTEVLRSHPNGNYTASQCDTQLNTLNSSPNVQTRGRNKYEVVRFVGYLSGKELAEAGVKAITEADYDTDMLADVWMVDSKIIKVDTSPFGDNPADHYHAFIFDEDEDSGLTGTGLPVVLRDSQMRLCSIDRATQDNMASSAGPVYEVNKDLLPPGQTNIGAIHAFKTIYREGTGADAAAPAIRQLDTNSHVTELIALRRAVLDTFDRESSLPGWLFGQTQQLGEAFRTSNNMSQMTGGANMVTKDIVRAYDLFTQSVIGTVVRWIMEFHPDPEVKGDYNVNAHGSISLVAKEVRGAALDQFWGTLSEPERLRFKDNAVLQERLKARDLPVDLLEEAEVADAKVEQYMAGQNARQQADADLTTSKTQKLQADAQRTAIDAESKKAKLQAEVAEILSRVDQNIAASKDRGARTNLERIKAMILALQNDMDRSVRSNESAAKILTMGERGERARGGTTTTTPEQASIIGRPEDFPGFS